MRGSRGTGPRCISSLEDPRVSLGVSLVGGGARWSGVRTVDLRPKRPLLAILGCDTLSTTLSISTTAAEGQTYRPGAVVWCPLAPWHHDRRLRWAVRPKSAILTCCAPGGAAIWAGCAQNGRDGLQDVQASLPEQSKARTPPGRTRLTALCRWFSPPGTFLKCRPGPALSCMPKSTFRPVTPHTTPCAPAVGLG